MNQEDIMLRSPAFLGFSMVRRKSRRRLVVVTYAILLAFMAVMMAVSTSAPRMIGGRFAGFMWCLLLAYNVVTWSIFGRLAKDTVLPQIRGDEITSLGLTPRPRRSEYDLDERELAVRNAAYFTAYRAVAVYSILAWMVLMYSFELSTSTAFILVQWLVIPLLAMVLTLPPAVVLWREPDVPEEARA
jgi:hypothetical protein